MPVHPLPGASPELLGLAEFTGEPIPVLDLGRLVNAPPGARPTSPVTVVAWAGPPRARELVGPIVAMTVTEYAAKVFEPETIGEAVVLSIQPSVVPLPAAVELWNWPLVHAEA